MTAPHTTPAIHDTETGLVHVPDPYAFPAGLDNLDEFVAWLNTKAESPGRYTVVAATGMARRARAGLSRQYTEYLKGEPAVRLRAALRRVLTDRAHHRDGAPVSLVHNAAGGWDLPHATHTIRAIAAEADVDFNAARAVLLAHLTAELGAVMDRVAFPPEDAVRPDDDPLSGQPVRL